jgi:hypothetical protein
MPVGAGAALIVGALTAWTAGHRENVRWTRERQERHDQWNRERTNREEQWQREDRQRWLQTRQQAYARFIADLREWDDKLGRAVASRKLEVQHGMPHREIDKTEAEQAGHACREDSALVVFMAPEPVAGQVRYAVSIRPMVMHALDFERITEQTDVVQVDQLWKNAIDGRTSLEKAMREDLEIVDDSDQPEASDPAGGK